MMKYNSMINSNDSHKEHGVRKEHKEESGGFCLLSYREVVKFRLLTTTPFFLLCALCPFVFFV